MSFRSRLIVSLILISTIPLLIVSYLSYDRSVEINKSENIRYSTRLAENSIHNFNMSIKNLNEVMFDILSFKELHDFLKGTDFETDDLDDFDKLLTKLDIKLFTIFSMNRDIIKGIYIFPDNNMTPYYRTYRSSNLNVLQKFKESDIYDKTKELKGKQLWTIMKNDKLYYDGNIANSIEIILSSAIIDMNSNKMIGTICIYINPNYIQEMFGQIEQQNGEYTFVLSEDNRVVVHPDNELVGSLYDRDEFTDQFDRRDKGYEMITTQGEKSLITFSASEINGWKVINVTPYRNIIKKSLTIAKGNIYIAVISITMAILASLILSVSMYRPISNLSKAMNKVDKKRLNVKLDIGKNDEFGMLAKNFNQLTDRIQNLVNQVNKEQFMKKEAEMNALRAQINPHFIYNTLNIIKCLARDGDYGNIQKVTVSLIDLLRISVGDNNDAISIKDEIKYIESYLSIQKLRLDVQFDCLYDIASDIYIYEIPKLTIQPIVENSILHGIQGNLDRQNIIKIKGYEDNGLIRIIVEDNGSGISEEKVRDLEAFFTGKKRYKFSNVGLLNVDQRIKLKYGESYGLNIKTHVNKGTMVTMTFPAFVKR